MHLTTVLAVLSLAGVGSAVFGVTGESQKKVPLVGGTKRFILELSKDSDLERLTSELSTREGTKLYKTFESEIFTGVSIETTIENEETLRILQNVGNVWQSRRIEMATVENGREFSSAVSAANYSIHNMTGVNKLHEAGILGKGVKVAVVDAGVDYNHPALGGGFGPEFKVIGGYDLIGSSYWPDQGFDKNPDDDPMEGGSNGHGTHVSGIVAGKSDSWQGVAPEANILSYKVFGDNDSGQTDEETLIDAFLRALADGADIITSSIGGRGGFANNAWAEVASRMVDQGVIVTISAGNDGESGLFFPDNGMSGKNVLAVASTEPDNVPGLPFEVTFNDGEHKSTATWAFFSGTLTHNFPLNGTLQVIALTTDPKNVTVGCTKFPEDVDLSHALVVVPRGGCSAATKRYVLFAAGAEHVLFFNDEKIFPLPDNWDTRGADGIIGQEEGIALTKALADGVTVHARFFEEDKLPLLNMKNPTVVASYFTSLGGLYDLSIKPDIAAPGSNIFSTLPHGRFGLKSGTSMATPYVAGIAALYIGKYGGRWVHGPDFAKKLAARIMSSGDSLGWSDGTNVTDYGTYAPIFQLGTGLVNATKVLEYQTELSWAKFALNDTAHFESCQRVNITNNCTEPITYKFSHQAAGAFEALTGRLDFASGPGLGIDFAPIEVPINVTFPEGEFTVEPGQTKEATFHFNPPKGLNASALPVYSGKILINGSNDGQLSVPYMGVAADVQKTFRQMFSDNFPYILSTQNMTRIEDDSTFSFDLSIGQQDFPRLFITMRWGAPLVRWDIFERGWTEKNWTYPPVPGVNGFIGMAAPWNNENYVSVFDPETDNELDIVRGPLTELSRDAYGYSVYRFWWLGRFTNGYKIRPGNYTMRVAALIPFGDPDRSEHWDIWSHDFKVVLGNWTTPFSAKNALPPVPLRS
ncbi:Minor extracellular protease vpr [Colletotrichum sp. SAR 10_65]|nr:Minor extracellular protease vpr [Colletotrichum sp. SAR 10_65]